MDSKSAAEVKVFLADALEELHRLKRSLDRRIRRDQGHRSQPDPTPAIKSYATSSLDHHDVDPEETLEAEVIEPEGVPAANTPPRIAEMIKAGAFDRNAVP